jgi:hypothetical protein
MLVILSPTCKHHNCSNPRRKARKCTKARTRHLSPAADPGMLVVRHRGLPQARTWLCDDVSFRISSPGPTCRHHNCSNPRRHESARRHEGARGWTWWVIHSRISTNCRHVCTCTWHHPLSPMLSVSNFFGAVRSIKINDNAKTHKVHAPKFQGCVFSEGPEAPQTAQRTRALLGDPKLGKRTPVSIKNQR